MPRRIRRATAVSSPLRLTRMLLARIFDACSEQTHLNTQLGRTSACRLRLALGRTFATGLAPRSVASMVAGRPRDGRSVGRHSARPFPLACVDLGRASGSLSRRARVRWPAPAPSRRRRGGAPRPRARRIGRALHVTLVDRRPRAHASRRLREREVRLLVVAPRRARAHGASARITPDAARRVPLGRALRCACCSAS